MYAGRGCGSSCITIDVVMAVFERGFLTLSSRNSVHARRASTDARCLKKRVPDLQPLRLACASAGRIAAIRESESGHDSTAIVLGARQRFVDSNFVDQSPGTAIRRSAPASDHADARPPLEN